MQLSCPVRLLRVLSGGASFLPILLKTGRGEILPCLSLGDLKTHSWRNVESLHLMALLETWSSPLVVHIRQSPLRPHEPSWA